MSLAPIIKANAQLIHASSAPQAPGASTPDYEEQRKRDMLLHGMSMEENEQKSLLATERDATDTLMKYKMGIGQSALDPLLKSLRSGYSYPAPRAGVQPAAVKGKTNDVASNITTDLNPYNEEGLSEMEKQYRQLLGTAKTVAMQKARGFGMPSVFGESAVPTSSAFNTESPSDFVTQAQNSVMPSSPQQSPSLRTPSYWGGEWDYGGMKSPVVNSYATVGNTIEDLLNLNNNLV